MSFSSHATSANNYSYLLFSSSGLLVSILVFYVLKSHFLFVHSSLYELQLAQF